MKTALKSVGKGILAIFIGTAIGLMIGGWIAASNSIDRGIQNHAAQKRMAPGLVVEPAKAPTQLELTFKAICVVESGNDPKAFNESEQARGIAQIRPIMVDEVNRILGRDEFTHDDAWNPAKSAAMFAVYCYHWRPSGTPEQWARIWNGGPAGDSKESTIKYWEKVKGAM